ncbi:hypothetical protein [Dickeya phage Mysterion]|uniref:Uncharacterized protein n=1 Tax=Dickeya phage Mysterion TaxID=2320193 RepID=A0A385IG01_9CAUD|nr:hypothetical protein HOU15_gp08 [Dickeya phage Mysterion]AXY81941.1 hypothetical protein [Dickeya phage Mysterion]
MNLNPQSMHSREHNRAITQITLDLATLELLLISFELTVKGWPTDEQWSLRNQLKAAIASNKGVAEKSNEFPYFKP